MGQDTRAHSSRPKPGPPGTANKATGELIAGRPYEPTAQGKNDGQTLFRYLDNQ